MLTNKYTKCCHYPLYSFGSHLKDGIWKYRENSSIYCFFPLATAPHTKTDANWIYQRKQGWMTFKENTNLMGNSQNWKICVQINFCHLLVTLSSDGLSGITQPYTALFRFALFGSPWWGWHSQKKGFWGFRKCKTILPRKLETLKSHKCYIT